MRLSRGASIAELERVYRADFLRFVRVATAIGGDEETGADAVHDAFVQAVRNRRSYRGDGSLEGWVWRMVVNAAKKRVPPAKDPVLDETPTQENGFGDPLRSPGCPNDSGSCSSSATTRTSTTRRLPQLSASLRERSAPP
jgi:DNA-directed RNA polymerase specialized sigma24 family protein